MSDGRRDGVSLVAKGTMVGEGPSGQNLPKPNLMPKPTMQYYWPAKLLLQDNAEEHVTLVLSESVVASLKAKLPPNNEQDLRCILFVPEASLKLPASVQPPDGSNSSLPPETRIWYDPRSHS